MSGGGVKNLFDPAGIFHDNGSVKGQGFFDQGGALNSMLDPLDLFGGRATGQAKQLGKQQAADQQAQVDSAQSDLNSILAGGGAPQYGADGLPIAGTAQPPMYGGGMNQGMQGSYHPPQILAPQLLQGPNRTPNQNQMPLLAHQAFAQVLAPFQQPNWGLQQVNPAFLTGEARFANGQVPDGNVVPQRQGFGQMPTRQTTQPVNFANLNQRAWM
jgi:hypothetical protein